VEEAHPGALASQWIPVDPALWKIQNYRDFLESRKEFEPGAGFRQVETAVRRRWGGEGVNVVRGRRTR
jgi:hypothetical protein